MRTSLRTVKTMAVGVKCAWLSGILSARKLRPVLFLAGLLTPSIASAIIFPLAQEPYDDTKNLVKYSYPHERRQEVGYFTNQVENAPFLGTAIAANWFITANHTALYGGVHTFYDYQGKPHDVVSVAPYLNLGGGGPDLALVRVAQVLPYYSRIAKTAALTNQQARVYGLSSSSFAHGALRGSSGNIQARFNVPGTGTAGLRWGLAKFNIAFPPLGILSWPFTAADPDLGNNCAGIALLDSGGPIFLRRDGIDTDILTGIITQTSTVNVNTNANSNVNCFNAYAWNGAGVYVCGTSYPSGPANGQGVDVGRFAAAIYSIISPPIRSATTAAATGWIQGAFGSGAAKATNYSVAYGISTNGVINPAPQSVYQNVTMIPYTKSNNQMRFVADNLLRNEVYKVRVHLSSIPITGLDYSKVTETITITDANSAHLFRKITPYASGLNKAMVLDFPDSFIPTPANRITVGITPGSAGAFAVVSGIEIVLNQ